MNKYLLFAISFLSFGVAAATPNETGNITFLQVHKNPDSNSSSGERFIVRLSSTSSNNSCGSDQWTGYLTTEAGRAQYSALLAIAIASKQVKLEGTPNRCESSSLLIRNLYVAW